MAVVFHLDLSFFSKRLSQLAEYADIDDSICPCLPHFHRRIRRKKKSVNFRALYAYIYIDASSWCVEVFLMRRFYVGHGPFPSYLYRFRLRETDECTCGEEGTQDHYAFECPLTANNHLKKPSTEHYKAWAVQTTKNAKAISKINNIMNYLINNIDYISP
ncbi:retrovirus-related Pol polyprotein from type-1 retrotransposable element R1 [Caerostris extrusa]|uniref:Retrovirus-related Pol polyprotein from type-1 retrotransposable element R1 n=1 Tax=Caerostris extrusa TaxID=172846 RepID=A0AAV4V8G8_CAEEX|nr:retrovirus-related Pol polyprotein from type-1 retrotransposable element R1 [Caerostris extrusa]